MGLFFFIWHKRHKLDSKFGAAILIVNLILTLLGMAMTSINFKFNEDKSSVRKVLEYTSAIMMVKTLILVLFLSP